MHADKLRDKSFQVPQPGLCWQHAKVFPREGDLLQVLVDLVQEAAGGPALRVGLLLLLAVPAAVLLRGGEDHQRARVLQRVHACQGEIIVPVEKGRLVQ